MTPAEIRSLRKKLNLTSSKFAELLGFTGKNCHITVYRWEAGKRRPSPQAVILMEQLARNAQKTQATGKKG